MGKLACKRRSQINSFPTTRPLASLERFPYIVFIQFNSHVGETKNTLFEIKTLITGGMSDVKNVIEIVGKIAIEKLVLRQAVNQQPILPGKRNAL